jgi:hypothetical protein
MNQFTTNNDPAYATLIRADLRNLTNPGMTGSKAFRMGMYLLAFLLAFTLKGMSATVATTMPGDLSVIPSKEVIANMTKEQKEARMETMKERVKEIKAMDRSNMTKADRKALRMELKQMNKEAHAMGYAGGVYISVGALIIIILLLILILH